MNSVFPKYLFAAGGTGGHLYPAIAVAEEIKNLQPNSKILFVGTANRIESRIIPQLGYDFKTLWISGLSRRITIKNLLFPVKLLVAIVQSFVIIISFKPNVAVGAGAYVSGPIVWIASLFGSKIVLLEQNSFPGATNRMLENKADQIHLSFEESKKYFKNKSKLKLSGNPIRTNLELTNKQEALKEFDLDPVKKTILVLGGSGGAKSINEGVKNNLKDFTQNDLQVIWQTGDFYFEEYKHHISQNVKVFPFISEMSKAYSACDLVLARAGATTIAEVAYLELPVIFVPSINVAANHQYLNAKSLADNNAALLIEDNKINDELSKTILNIINDNIKLNALKINIKKFSKPNAASNIAKDIINLSKG